MPSNVITLPQTSVNRMRTAFPGMDADTGLVNHTPSKVSAEASAEIPFGVMVLRDATNKESGVVLPHTDAATSAPLVAGVVRHSHAYVEDIEVGDIGIKPKMTVNVKHIGRIFVQPEESVAPGDPVRFRAVAPGSEQVGAFLKTASAGNTVDISSFARWVTAGSSTNPCILELDAVNASLASAD